VLPSSVTTTWARGLEEHAGEFVEAGGGADAEELLAHELGDLQLAELAVEERGAAGLEALAVDALAAEATGGEEGDDCRDHQREDDVMVERHLEDDEDGGDRGVGGGGEETAHAGEGEAGGVEGGQPREERGGGHGEGAGDGADEEGGSEHAADGAGPEGGGGGEDLHGRDGEQQRHGVVTGLQQMLDDGHAVAHGLGPPERERADDGAAEREAHGEREVGELEGLAGVAQEPPPEVGADTAAQAEQQVERHGAERGPGDGADGVERAVVEERAVDQHGDDGCDEQRPERLHRDRTEDDLGDEERAAQRGVVGGSDTGRGAAGDDQAHARRRHAAETAEEEAPRRRAARAVPRGRWPRRRDRESAERERRRLGRTGTCPSPTTTASM
jgi:hypothetical protein